MVIKVKGKTLLLLATGAGMIVTVFLAAKKAPEAQEKKEAALKAKRDRTGDENAQLTWFESAQAQFGSYVPAIVTGLATLGSLAGSEVLNEKNLKKAEAKFGEFKEMTERIDGKGAVKTVEKAIEQKKLDEKSGKPWDRPETFRLVFQGHSVQFEKKRSDVIEAFYEANRLFHGRGSVTFNEFLQYLGLESMPEGDDRGWECYIGETVYGYSWIDFGLKECPEEPWVTEIFFPVYPHFLDENSCDMEIENGCKKLGIGESEPWPEDG